MALARNLKRRPRSKFKLPKLKKKGVVVLIVCAILFGAYGVLSLSRLSPKAGDKKDITFETGDKPLPAKTQLWVTAEGGLNMRENPDAKSKILILIPFGTKLESDETQGDWYRVTYMDKAGWVNKKYVTTQAPTQSPTTGWKNFQNKSFGYSVQYPTDWVVQDYGANPATNSQSYVGFGPQLAPQLNPSALPPVILRVMQGTKEQAEASYKSSSGAVAEPATVSGLAATKYTFTSSSGAQMTAYIVPKGALTYIIEETGGYTDELGKMIGGLSLG